MSELYSILVNRHGLRWSNEFGWCKRPFEIYAWPSVYPGPLFNKPGDGNWEALPDNEPIEREQTKIVAMNNKSWELPMVLPFWTGPSGLVKKDWSFYEVVAYRNPKKGEYYLSGDPVEVWEAPNDLTSPYPIVVPTQRAIRFSGWVKEEE